MSKELLQKAVSFIGNGIEDEQQRNIAASFAAGFYKHMKQAEPVGNTDKLTREINWEWKYREYFAEYYEDPKKAMEEDQDIWNFIHWMKGTFEVGNNPFKQHIELERNIGKEEIK